MKMLLLLAAPYAYAFDNDALVPEIWAQEALMVLENNMIMGQLVHRDFSNEIANFGDTVNAHRPAERQPTRKTDSDEVDSTSTDTENVPVVLNQHIYDSFIIKDGEESKSFKDLVQLHLVPTVMGMAQFIDQALIGNIYQFMDSQSIGKLGTDIGQTTLTGLRDIANQRRIPQQGRNFVVSSQMEAALLNTDLFVSAEKVGDNGTALREGSLGRKFGLNVFMDQNAPNIAAGNIVVTGAINNVAGYGVGAVTFTVDGFSAAITAGSWITIGGDMGPLRVLSTVGGATPTSITVDAPGLRYAVLNDAVVTVYTPGAINLVAGYGANWLKDIAVDGFTVSPKSGQLISIGAVAGLPKYASLSSRNSPTTTSLMLDRPLEAAVVNDAVVGVGPAGNYGLCFHKNALAMVSRPLAAPRPGTGAAGFTANYNGMAMRVVITYDGKAQGHRVTVDTLLGTKVLDPRLGIAAFG